MKNDKKQAYTCKIFTVWEENILLQNDKITRQSWVEHQPTVAITAVNQKNELLLIRQYRNACKQILWEIPAGTMDHGNESPADCAGRELAEETGYRAEKLTPLFAGYLLPGYCNEFMYFFLAQDLSYEPLKPDDDEFIEVIPTSFEQADKLIQSGEIVDAKTVLGIMLAKKFFSSDTT